MTKISLTSKHKNKWARILWDSKEIEIRKDIFTFWYVGIFLIKFFYKMTQNKTLNIS